MVGIEERNLTGWQLRSIFETPEADVIDGESFFYAFGRPRVINGNEIQCILTPPKQSPAAYTTNSDEGIHRTRAVLIARSNELHGAKQGGSLNVDGTDYLILTVSRPIFNVIRLELEGYAG